MTTAACWQEDGNGRWTNKDWNGTEVKVKKKKQQQQQQEEASSIYDSTYAWRDNILTAAASLALPSYGSHYSGVSRVA
jgi:hypothetical protein